MSVSDRRQAVRGFMLGVWSFGIILESYLSTQPPGQSLLLQLLDGETEEVVVFIQRIGGSIRPLATDTILDETDVRSTTFNFYIL
jgi:hypothetical protein